MAAMMTLSSSSLVHVFESTIQNASVMTEAMGSRDLLLAFRITARLQDRIVQIFEKLNSILAQSSPLANSGINITSGSMPMQSGLATADVGQANLVAKQMAFVAMAAQQQQQQHSLSRPEFLVSTDAPANDSQPVNEQNGLRKRRRVKKPKSAPIEPEIAVETTKPVVHRVPSTMETVLSAIHDSNQSDISPDTFVGYRGRWRHDDRKSCSACNIDFPDIESFVSHIQQLHVIERGEEPNIALCGMRVRNTNATEQKSSVVASVAETTTNQKSLSEVAANDGGSELIPNWTSSDSGERNVASGDCRVSAATTVFPSVLHHWSLACATCSKSFPSPSDYKEHARTGCKSQAAPVFECKRCMSLENDIDNLTNHSAACVQAATNQKSPATRSTVDAGEFACPVCGKIFSHRRLLKQHEQGVHGPERYRCSHCQIGFNWRSTYYRHLERCHGDQTVAMEANDENVATAEEASLEQTGEDAYLTTTEEIRHDIGPPCSVEGYFTSVDPIEPTEEQDIPPPEPINMGGELTQPCGTPQEEAPSIDLDPDLAVPRMDNSNFPKMKVEKDCS